MQRITRPLPKRQLRPKGTSNDTSSTTTSTDLSTDTNDSSDGADTGSLVGNVFYIDKTDTATADAWTEAWVEVESTDATCNTAGVITYKNSLNEEITKEVEIPAIGHNMVEAERVEPTCTEDGYVLSVCSICGEEEKEVLTATGHDDGQWVVVKDASFFGTGEKQLQCTIDGAVIETQTIDATSPLPIWAYIIIGCGVAAVVVVVVVVAKKKKA